MSKSIRGLYICIDVDDVERAIAFYTRGLGLELDRRFDETWVELVGGPAPIHLLGRPAGTSTNPAPGAPVRDYGRHRIPLGSPCHRYLGRLIRTAPGYPFQLDAKTTVELRWLVMLLAFLGSLRKGRSLAVVRTVT